MKKWVMPACALFLSSVLGCGSDNHEKWIHETLDTLNKTTDQVRQIKKNITDEVAKAKEKKDLSADQFKPAFAITEELNKNGAILLELKRKIDARKDKITKEQREDFAQRYRDQLQKTVEDLAVEQKALDVALQQAEELNASAVVELKKKLREAQGKFELVSKQR